jgi:hypothetical protein
MFIVGSVTVVFDVTLTSVSVNNGLTRRIARDLTLNLG